MSKKLNKIIICAVMAVLTLVTASCSQKEQLPADIPQATERGRSDAQALLDIASDDIAELHSALLSVKAREWEMRREGHDQSADAYINAFKEYVSTQNKPLADEIF